MASSLNEANLEKRLLTVTNTQESIQTLSLWCLHHKVHAKKIIDIWMKVIKKVKISHRLALFYLANDVIQNGKRKGCAQFADAWLPVVKQTISLVRDEKVRPQIERILTIWNDRSVFDSQFITELHAILGKPSNTKAQAAVHAKILAEFKPQKLVDKIRKFKKLESEVEVKQKQFSSLKMDVCNTETLKQLKDKAHGTKFTKEFEDATTKLEEFVHILQREVKERTTLIELLEQSELFYETQKKEAKIVANAYKNFGSRVKNLQTKLKETMPNLPTPVPSPSLDAPSPVDSSAGESPTKEDAQDNKPVEGLKERKDKKEDKEVVDSSDGTKDNTEAVDMEMSDDDDGDRDHKEEESPIADVPSPGSAPSPEGSPVGLNLSPPVSNQPHSKATTSITSKTTSASSSNKASFIPSRVLPKTKGHITAASLFDSLISSAPAKTNASSLDIRLSNLMQNIPNFTSNLFGSRTMEGINALQSTSLASSAPGDEGGTPLKDEESGTGSATPLQDESREANYNSQPQKEGGGTPTIGDILQKLVATGSISSLTSHSVSSTGAAFNTQENQQQPWYNQSSQSQLPKQRLLPPPPPFGNFSSQITMSSNSQPFSPESIPLPAMKLETMLSLSPPYPYDPNSSTSMAGQVPSLNGDNIEPMSTASSVPQPNPVRISLPGQVYRRNSNIVELTPSPTGTPNFDGSNDSCTNHNLITLVQSSSKNNSIDEKKGESNVPTSTEPNFTSPSRTRTGLSAGRYAVSQLTSARSVMPANLLTVQSHTDNNGESESFPGESVPSLVDNSGSSNLRTIVPLVPYIEDDLEAKLDKGLPISNSGMSVTEVQTSYSKIETLDSRRDSMDRPLLVDPWNANAGRGHPYARRNEPTPQGWHQVPTHSPATPFRREGPYGPIRSFSFPRRGLPRAPWTPVGPPPKRPLLSSSVRPSRWAHNQPPY